MTDTAYIALGSNLGDREATLREALRLLGERDDISVVRASSFIETPPHGGPAGQGPYINAVAEIETSLAPRELLTALQQIETALGRDRAAEQRWGPRTCDMDILLMGETVLEGPQFFRTVVEGVHENRILFIVDPDFRGRGARVDGQHPIHASSLIVCGLLMP